MAEVNGYCTCNGEASGGRMRDCGIPAHRAEARRVYEPYTPTEDEVRWGYVWAADTATDREASEAFDRFLTQVRAEAYEQARRDMQADFDASVDLYRREGAAVALREAADALSLTPSKWPWHVLRARADRIEAEG